MCVCVYIEGEGENARLCEALNIYRYTQSLLFWMEKINMHMYYRLMESHEHNVDYIIKLLECLLRCEHLMVYDTMTMYEMYDREF